MKKIKFILIVLLLAGFGACNYLDVSPDLGISEEDIFSTYKNYSNFLDAAFRREYPGAANNVNARNLKLAAPYWIDQSPMRWTLEGCITDACVCGRKLARAMRSGSMSDETANRLTTATGYRPIMKVMFEIIRITNTSIANIDMLQDATDAQRNDLLARAYFARGMAHFTLCRYFGGMPYIDTKLGADDEWDMARLSGHDTYVRCAEDFGRAADYYRAAGLMRRDARPGEAGHLSSPDMWYANGCAALAMKGRALLYAASPLHNALGEEDWRLAAEACGEAIAAAEDAGFEMLPKEQWTDNFMNVQYTNEQLWCYSVGNIALSNSRFYGRYGRAQCNNQNNASGICPTQNFVDRFETIWGDPLDTEEDRAAAVALGHYNDQDPYADRDPRFDLTILHDGSKGRLEKRHGQYIQEHQGDVAHHYDRQCQEFRGRVGGRPAARNHPHGLLPEQGMERRTRQHGLSPFRSADPHGRTLPELCRGGQRVCGPRRHGGRTAAHGVAGRQQGAQPDRPCPMYKAGSQATAGCCATASATSAWWSSPSKATTITSIPGAGRRSKRI